MSGVGVTEPEAVIREALMRLDASRRGSINYAVYEAKKDGLAALDALVSERDAAWKNEAQSLIERKQALVDLGQAVAERDRYRDALEAIAESAEDAIEDEPGFSEFAMRVARAALAVSTS